MKTIRMLLAAGRAEARVVLGQFVAITVIIGPVIAFALGVTELHRAPGWAQGSVITIIGLAELAWLITWLRRIHRLAGELPAYEDVVRGWGFVIWQCQRDMHLRLAYPIRSLDKGSFVRRYVLASRLDTYQRTIAHQRWWEQLLRRIPREFVLYVVVYGSMTKLFDLARLNYARRTLDFDRARWMIDTIARVNAIYSV